MKKVFKLAGEITIDGLKQAQKDLNSFDKSIRKSIGPIVKFGKEAENIGKQFTKAFTVPIAAVGVAATKFAGDFEKSMVTSTAIMGNVSDDLKKRMSDTAKEISKNSTKSADELAKSYYYLASAGYNAEQSIAALGKVAKFAEAGQFDLAVATDLLTDAQSALGLATKDVTENEENLVRVSDVLVKANTLANASVQQFSEALTNRAGAAIRAVGKDIEEGVAVLAAFADQGTKGADAGTQLGIVTRDLQKAALENNKEFKKNNIAVFDASGEMRNYADIIGDVEKALEGKSDADKKATLSTLGFQEKSVASLLTLVGTSDKIREYEKNLRSAGGTTEDVANKQVKNFNDQLKILLNRLQVTAINLGEILLPILQDHVLPAAEKFVQEIENMVIWFSRLPAPFKNAILGFTAFVTLLGPSLIGIGKFLGLLKLLPAAIGAVKLAVTGLTAVLAANPWLAIVGAVAALGVALYNLNKHYKNVNKTIEANRKKVKEDVEAKQLEMKKGLTEELIYNYKKLANMDKEVISRDEYIKAKNAIDNLETSLGDLGQEFTGGFKKRLVDAEAYLKKLNETTKESTDDIEKETNALKDISKSFFTTTAEVKALAKAEEDLNKKREEDNKEFLQRKKAAKKYEMELEQNALEDQKSINDKYRELNANSLDERIQLLVEARNEEELQAEMVGANKEAITKYYNDQIDKLRKEDIEKERQANLDKMNTVNGYVQQVIGLFQGLYTNRAIQIDNNYKKEKENVENSVLDEQAKAAALEDIDNKYAKKKKELAIKQAVADKASALFSIGINTASAIVEALPNLFLSGFIGALGAAQAAIVASRPIPEMEEGGIIRSSAGGTLVKAGEAGQDEGFIPMVKGTADIASAIIDNMRRDSSIGSNIAAATGTAPVSFHIGTFIGDEEGIKQLTRKVIPYINSENRRRGV